MIDSLKHAVLMVIAMVLGDIQKQVSLIHAAVARTAQQVDTAMKGARDTLSHIVQIVDNILRSNQRVLARQLSPHIEEAMRPAYENALLIRGKGSLARRRVQSFPPSSMSMNLTLNVYQDALHTSVTNLSVQLYAGLSELILERTTIVIDEIEKAVYTRFEQLAEEVNLNIDSIYAI